MGQQQLILLVLATVIVGLAIVVGIRAFAENNVRSNADALTHDALRIANDAQAWMIKPQAMGGSPNADKAATDWSNISWAALGYPSPAAGCGEYGNTNGCFTLVGTATEVTIEATTANSQNALANSLTDHNEVTIEVTGLTDEDMETTIVIGAY